MKTVINELHSHSEILIVDNDPISSSALKRIIRKEGFSVIEATDGHQVKTLMNREVAVVVVELHIPNSDGFSILSFIKENYPDSAVIIISGKSSHDEIVKVMRLGAFWFLDKPYDSYELLNLITIANEFFQLKRSNKKLQQLLNIPNVPLNLAAKSPAMRQVLAKINKIAGLDSTVFISGSSGTGKTTIARLIHQSGPRKDMPFICLSCASIPRDLLEAELFGHEKGAYTGAGHSRPGCIEMANGGTLFLDEIGELPLELQPKLLSFLQDRQVRRIGSNKVINFDVRVIAATNRNLAEMCRDRLFREDLYFRINVLSIELPDLKERREDIPDIARMCLERIAKSRSEAVRQISNEALTLISDYSWPGNVRELENVLERATAFSESPILGLESMASLIKNQNFKQNETTIVDLTGLSLEEIERKAIRSALQLCQGHRARAAELLGISTKSIYNKANKYGL